MPEARADFALKLQIATSPNSIGKNPTQNMISEPNSCMIKESTNYKSKASEKGPLVHLSKCNSIDVPEPIKRTPIDIRHKYQNVRNKQPGDQSTLQKNEMSPKKWKEDRIRHNNKQTIGPIVPTTRNSKSKDTKFSSDSFYKQLIDERRKNAI